MSYRVVGYQDGHRVIFDEGPNSAHMLTRGGMTLGQILTAPPSGPQVRYGDPNGARTRRNGLRGEHMLKRQTRYSDRERCGQPVISVHSQVIEACHRLPGHLPGHRSKAAMDGENTRRMSRARVRQ